jgi:hypothetical protein
LSNTFCNDVFPNNTSGEFTNLLNEPIASGTAISLSEVYYAPKAWHNVRDSNNDIIMKFSQIGNHYTTHAVTCRIPTGLYTDVFDLMRAIVSTMNRAAFNFFKGWYGNYGEGGDWLARRGQYEREYPKWVLEKTKYDKLRPEALVESKQVWKIPHDWDPNLIDSRFFYMSIRSGRVVFGRFLDQSKHQLELAFSNGIAQLLGYSLFWQERQWNTFHRDSRASKYGSHHYPDHLPKMSVQQESNAEFHPNMDAMTLQTMWIMCDVIEDTRIGSHLNLPILRALPNNPYNQHNSLHMFGIPQFKKILSSNGVDQIHIRMCEDLDGTILAIYGDVFLRFEIQ